VITNWIGFEDFEDALSWRCWSYQVVNGRDVIDQREDGEKIRRNRRR